MKYTINTPEGTRDLLFAECRDRRRVQAALTGLFRRRGYAEVSTPEVEFYDIFLQSGNPMPQEAMLKIIDRSGKIMVMRPDCTTPIARVAATKLRTMTLPQRLYYQQTVFRSGAEHRGGSSEIAQCGVEGVHVELGHAGFFRDLAVRMDLDGEATERMRLLIEGKNFAALNDLLEPYAGRPACAALKRLSRLFGGVEVLDEAEALAGENEAVAYLRALYGELSAAGYGGAVRFDLGMVHQIDYYTGVVFRGYVEGAGAPVLSGGRYDKLCEAFGRPAPATGFAVDVDAVAGCLPTEEPPCVGTLIHFGPGGLARALRAVDGRVAGSCEISPCATLEATMALAREKGACSVLVLEEDGERMVSV